MYGTFGMYVYNTINTITLYLKSEKSNNYNTGSTELLNQTKEYGNNKTNHAHNK